MSETIHVALYGVIAALSPTVLLATLAVLSSGRGRMNGIVFTFAFVAGQTLALVVALFVGTALTPEGRRDNVAVVLELLVGVGLVAIALRRRRRGPSPARGTPRAEALFARLERVGVAVSFGVGLPLGIGAKRLIITIVAATTIAAGGLSRAENISLSGLYVAVATVIVWAPVAIYFVLGARADGLIADTRGWIIEHEDQVTTVSALVIGVFLVLDATASLVL